MSLWCPNGVMSNCGVFFFQAEDGIRDLTVTGVQTCALPILLAELGVPDVVVNNAGTFFIKRIEETSLEEFTRTLAVNLTGPFLVVRAFVPHLVQRGAGHLVTIGDRKSTRLNSSHSQISYAVFCLKK